MLMINILFIGATNCVYLPQRLTGQCLLLYPDGVFNVQCIWLIVTILHASRWCNLSIVWKPHFTSRSQKDLIYNYKTVKWSYKGSTELTLWDFEHDDFFVSNEYNFSLSLLGSSLRYTHCFCIYFSVVQNSRVLELWLYSITNRKRIVITGQVINFIQTLLINAVSGR